jgi:hypothetical protein
LFFYELGLRFTAKTDSKAMDVLTAICTMKKAQRWIPALPLAANKIVTQFVPQSTLVRMIEKFLQLVDEKRELMRACIPTITMSSDLSSKLTKAGDRSNTQAMRSTNQCYPCSKSGFFNNRWRCERDTERAFGVMPLSRPELHESSSELMKNMDNIVNQLMVKHYSEDSPQQKMTLYVCNERFTYNEGDEAQYDLFICQKRQGYMWCRYANFKKSVWPIPFKPDGSISKPSSDLQFEDVSSAEVELEALMRFYFSKVLQAHLMRTSKYAQEQQCNSSPEGMSS